MMIWITDHGILSTTLDWPVVIHIVMYSRSFRGWWNRVHVRSELSGSLVRSYILYMSMNVVRAWYISWNEKKWLKRTARTPTSFHRPPVLSWWNVHSSYLACSKIQKLCSVFEVYQNTWRSSPTRRCVYVLLLVFAKISLPWKFYCLKIARKVSNRLFHGWDLVSSRREAWFGTNGAI